MAQHVADGDPGLPCCHSSEHQGPDQACKGRNVKEQCHSQEGIRVPETHLTIQAISPSAEAQLVGSISSAAPRVERFQIMACQQKQVLNEEHLKSGTETSLGNSPTWGLSLRNSLALFPSFLLG